MSNFDDMKFAVQALSGGTNTVILDDMGIPLLWWCCLSTKALT